MHGPTIDSLIRSGAIAEIWDGRAGQWMVFDMDAGDKLALGDVAGRYGIEKLLGVVEP